MLQVRARTFHGQWLTTLLRSFLNGSTVSVQRSFPCCTSACRLSASNARCAFPTMKPEGRRCKIILTCISDRTFAPARIPAAAIVVVGLLASRLVARYSYLSENSHEVRTGRKKARLTSRARRLRARHRLSAIASYEPRPLLYLQAKKREPSNVLSAKSSSSQSSTRRTKSGCGETQSALRTRCAPL